MRTSERSKTRSAQRREASAEPATILVVDDEPLARETLTDLLQAQGYKVVTAMDGDSMLAALEHADLVLLDAMLPGRDGWELCREVKELHDPLLPIIMVTARTAPDDVVRTFAAGADDYVPKPFQVAELTARIESRLRAHRAEQALQEATRNASELAEQNYRLYEQAKADAEERATLLRELDHRVRNNLSVIMGLVSMERHRQPSPEAGQALMTLENRLRSFMTAYEGLRRRNYRGVPLRETAERLAQRLRGMYDPDLRVQVDVLGDDFAVNERQGFSVALALNELLTNVFRHAFPGGREGRLCVRLSRQAGDLVIQVEDDGVGLPEARSDAGLGSGRSVVETLIKTELGGRVSYTSAGTGTRATLVCPLRPSEVAAAQ